MSVAPTTSDRSPYRGYRFPPEIIAHAVWLYFRFHLSFRDVQDLLAERGVIVSHESLRQWCNKFGAAFAGRLCRRRARVGDKWHLDEVMLKINGKRHWLWRAVDQNGVVLDILVQSRRDQQAAERFLRQVC
jgi:putative transposase